jgi:hypothetical protein
VRCVAAARQSQRSWTVPGEYLVEHVSDTVGKILVGFHGGAAGPATIGSPGEGPRT